jgi:hypothetical protein
LVAVSFATMCFHGVPLVTCHLKKQRGRPRKCEGTICSWLKNVEEIKIWLLWYRIRSSHYVKIHQIMVNRVTCMRVATLAIYKKIWANDYHDILIYRPVYVIYGMAKLLFLQGVRSLLKVNGSSTHPVKCILIIVNFLYHGNDISADGDFVTWEKRTYNGPISYKPTNIGYS